MANGGKEVIESQAVVDLSEFTAKMGQVEERVRRSDKRVDLVKARVERVRRDLMLTEQRSVQLTQQLRSSITSIGSAQIGFAISQSALSSFDMDQSSFLFRSLATGAPAVLTGLATGGPMGAFVALIGSLFATTSASIAQIRAEAERTRQKVDEVLQKTENLNREFQRNRQEQERLRLLDQQKNEELIRTRTEELLYRSYIIQSVN